MRFDGRPETLELLREIAEAIVDPVFLVDKAFNVWYYNRSFEQTVGVRMNSRQYRDRPCYDLLGLTICKTACVMKQAVATGKNVRLAEILGHTAGGEAKTFHINAVPVTGADGQPFGSLIFLRDITAEAQIQEKYKRLVSKNTGIALSGQLEGNLIDVIQLLAFLQKSGQLILQRGADEAFIAFERGQMVAALLGRALNTKALDRMLGWKSGSFSFSPNVTVDVSKRFEGSVDFILMDLVRQRDELEARLTDLPDLGAPVKVVRFPAEGDPEVDATALALLQQLGKGTIVAEALEPVEASDSALLLALLKLRDAGIVSW